MIVKKSIFFMANIYEGKEDFLIKPLVDISNSITRKISSYALAFVLGLSTIILKKIILSVFHLKAMELLFLEPKM